MPNIKSQRLIKAQARRVAEAEHRYACQKRAYDNVEYDVRRCMHGIIQMAKDSSWLSWRDLEWFWEPILAYRARRALRGTDNEVGPEHE